MIDTQRIDHVTVATPDSAAAEATFRRSFGFAPAAPGALQIGDARIEFVTPAAGTTLAEILASSGEGMAELCLQVASLESAARSLTSAGVGHTRDGGALRIDPKAAHGVRLSLIERR
jgi:catechol 2,3-dioxygenase-like lactoylglutathione lyase family enzyme